MAILSLPLALPDLTVSGSPLRAAAIALALTWCLRTISYILHVRKLPPGPPKHLLLDNRGDMPFPVSQPWKSFQVWHRKFGSIISLYLGRKAVVSLGTIGMATELLEKRGGIYSSRPKAYVVGDILTRNMRGLGMPYGQRWRNWRALMHASMGIEASNGYKPLQDAESKVLLRDIYQNVDTPKSHPDSIRRYAVSIVTVVSYGRRIASLSDPLVLAQDKMDHYYITASVPGKFLVDIFPILSWLPASLQWWRAEPEAHFHEDSKLLLGLMHEVRGRMERGVAYASTATRALEKQGAFGLDDLETAYALSAPFGAGAGTTLATVDFFMVAMLLYPEAMGKAQEEIDRVVGRDRLPEYDDSAALPYLHALIKEVMRWRAIAPMGVPHCTTADDVYEGKVIPAGTTVIASIYTMSQDAETFPEPDKFRPERYLENPQLPYSFLFGFGRRVCPGLHIAQNSLFILFSRILWAFDVLPPTDVTGTPTFPDPDATVGGLVLKPAPFDYRLVPRAAHAQGALETIIITEAEKADVQLGAYD
ncbi:cytochrome P450 [Ephemerocybe angulata]|uniref:Cytochrome P450 n=1 Tax=Ephemerocybe angulata TaxID=980116 RepID=A0A8H6M376_9AGAR|nr:cytochrome P450 [Tulosesus angulatus]